MLIALAIVAMSVGALLGTITSSASNVSYLKDKTLAEWVALNRLTEIRIAQQMPDPGKRTGNAEMGGMRWQWEEEVTELPDRRACSASMCARGPPAKPWTTRAPVDKPTSQQERDSRVSGSDTEKLTWTTTVTGVIGSARSDRRDAIAAPMRGGGRHRRHEQSGRS